MDELWSKLIFYLFAVTTCACAIAVVVSQNIVRMALWLLFALGTVAGLFFMLDADFVGATQLLIYVGGTAVLLIFGVMLTASGPFVSLKTRTGDWIMGALLGSALLGFIIASAVAYDWPTAPQPADAATATDIGLALLGIRTDAPAAEGSEQAGFLLPFEIVSVHLLVVLIGAAYLARAKRRAPRRPSSEEPAAEGSAPRM